MRQCERASTDRRVARKTATPAPLMFLKLGLAVVLLFDL